MRCGPGLALAGAILLFSGCGEDPEARRGSIYDWKADPTDANVAKIRGLLDDPDRDVRATALNVIVSLRVADASSVALAGLADPDEFVRATAAKVLGDLGEPAASASLVERLREDPASIVRRRAAEALTKIGGPAALAGLAEGASDPLDEVRLPAVKGLRKLDPNFAKVALVRLLLEDSTWEVRVRAATALGLTHDPEILPVLEAALEDANEFVRSSAANAIRIHASAPAPAPPAGEAAADEAASDGAVPREDSP